jgi:ABC-type sulfate transport system permease subunit
MHRVENRILFSITGYENINMFSLNPEIAQELAPIQAKKNHAENQK